MPLTQLPPVPVPLADLPGYVADHPDTPVTELFAPYRQFENTLRGVFAQEPDHLALADPHVNLLPVFGGGKDGTDGGAAALRMRARDVAAESAAERACYIMALPDNQRRQTGTAVTVPSLAAFQTNFGVFSEGALAGLDWSNVVAAGSSVVNCLLPVPVSVTGTAEGGTPSRRALRTYYHETFCPASDVDLFLYGLTEAQAVEKIRQIEATVRDAVLAETTTVRSRHTVTICSEYPTRHIQIVLRRYASVSEILAGFDVDCSAAAYDGRQVYCAPRALQAYLTQCNHIDLARRSPSYEARLAKYSHRGFEVCWPPLDRARIDPTLFDRSFARTCGLARLLVLERLPTADARQTYAAQRRKERGRPPLPGTASGGGGGRAGAGNVKATFDDEVAEWVSQSDVSGYETFVLPYGRKYTAKKIEKLCYTQDLLLNAEWNQKKDRDVYLHRHPVFFGRVDDILGDCCGCCPQPTTDREKEVAADESKTYVSGKISFLSDDPGRQEIGSFHPLTDDDWTDMAYIGNTARFCQAIVDGDLAYVRDWLDQDGDPNSRDHTGRTPLHLAVSCSTSTIVQCLVDHGARLIARLADGRTALHLAAERGDRAIVKILLDKSNTNEAEKDEKEDRRREAKRLAAKKAKQKVAEEEEVEELVVDDDEDDDDDDDDDDGDDDDDDDSSVGARTATSGSFVEVTRKNKQTPPDGEDFAAADDNDEPDVYDINAPAWDRPCSPLHLAIAHGHEAVVRLLCEDYGADVLQPVKVVREGPDHEPAAAMLALQLVRPLQPAATAGASMARTLLELGATAAQADMYGVTVLQRCVEAGRVAVVDELLQRDPAAAAAALRHLAFPTSYGSAKSALIEAIDIGHVRMVERLLAAGAPADISFDAWLRAAKAAPAMEGRLAHTLRPNNDSSNNATPSTKTALDKQRELFESSTSQPLIKALRSPNPRSALALLAHGAHPDTRTMESYRANSGYFYDSNEDRDSKTALDTTRWVLAALRAYDGTEKAPQTRFHFDHVAAAAYTAPVRRTNHADAMLLLLPTHSWRRWAASRYRRTLDAQYNAALATYEATMTRIGITSLNAKKAAIADMIAVLEEVEAKILATTEVPDTATATATANPDIAAPDAVNPRRIDTTFTFVPEFENVLDAASDTRRAAYTRLFEAAWAGDLTTIKRLTLTAWRGDVDDAEMEPPLNLGVRDSAHSQPFSLAFLRGHYDVAMALLAIAHAQNTTTNDNKKKPGVRYRLRAEGEPVEGHDDSDACCDETDSEVGTDSSDADDHSADNDKDGGARSIRRLYRSLALNKQFTVDNIGELNMKVKCTMKPLEILTASGPTYVANAADADAASASVSLFRFVAEQDDPRGLRFLLDAGERFAALQQTDADPTPNTSSYTYGSPPVRAAVLTDAGGGGPRFFRLPDDDIRALLGLGRIDMLATVLQRTGAGLPLDVLVEKYGGGLEVDVASSTAVATTTTVTSKLAPRRAYQGLTVYGRKRGDWAEAGRRLHEGGSGGLHGDGPVVDAVSPLLLAAAAGGRATVEWLLSGDGPRRCYQAFLEARAAAGDTRPERLRSAPGSWDGVLTQWLNRDRDLVLHAAVAGTRYDANQIALVEYLVRAVPSAVNARNTTGVTPLLVAAELGRIEMVRVLLGAGSSEVADDEDKDARDPAFVRQTDTGENLLHAALRHRPTTAQVTALLALLDPATQARLFCQRSRHDAPSKGRTPLHHWLAEVVPHYSDRNGDLCDSRGLKESRTYHDDDVEQAISAALAVLACLLNHSHGRELGLLDGAGDTLLHTLVAASANPRFLQAILEHNMTPDAVWPNAVLLRRENAVGITPLEAARDKLITVMLPSAEYPFHMGWIHATLVRSWPTEQPKQFAPCNELVACHDEDDVENMTKPLGQRVFIRPSGVNRMVAICQVLDALAQRFPGPRRLASLLEANDVAARISDTFQLQRYPGVGKAVDSQDAAEKKRQDEEAAQNRVPYVSVIPPEVIKTAWAALA